MREFICLYHGDCPDGFTAAWIVWKWGQANGEENITFVPCQYNQGSIPDVAGKHVIMVDFSFDQEAIEKLSLEAMSILILDHHAVAQEKLVPYIKDWSIRDAFCDWSACTMKGEKFVHAIFDMNKSGARLAQDFFMDDCPPFKLVDYVEDRDLWLHKLEDSNLVNQWIMSFPHDFTTFDNIAYRLAYPELRSDILSEAKAIVRTFERQMEKTVPEVLREMTIAGHRVPVANLPHFMVSDAAALLYESMPDAPFVAIYYDLPTGRKVSLRTKGSDFNVGQLAKEFGGGGHAAAASFIAPAGWEGDV